MQSSVQKEGKAHNEDTAKLDRKIKLPQKTHEGKTPDQKGAEIIEQKAKDVFEGKINKYGFLHFSKDLMGTLDWAKGEDIPVKITRTANGIAVERA
jgi:hypothetical protein